MRVPLLYGRGTIDAHIPKHADVTIVRKPSMPLIADPQQHTERALASVSSIANHRKNACILVCDITRPVPNGLFLRPLVERLIAGGIQADDITILIATGLHRPAQESELEELIGDPWVVRNISIVSHFAQRERDHVHIGTTRSGTPVKLDQRFVEAGLKIVTGLVEPHFMAGWSGGRKVLVPGIAQAEMIRILHSAKFLNDPGARACYLTGNPLHLEQIEIVAMLEAYTSDSIYAINTVIDEQRQLAFLNFGEVLASHAEAVQFAEHYCMVDVPHQFETVVTSSAGFPLDLTYYQTVKCMVTPLSIVGEDSTLIVASECREGLGSENFRNSQRKLLEEGSENFLNRIKGQRLAAVDEWETAEQLKATWQTRVQLFSEGLELADRELTGVEMVDSLETAIKESVARSKTKRVAVIPEGPYVVPQYAP